MTMYIFAILFTVILECTPYTYIKKKLTVKVPQAGPSGVIPEGTVIIEDNNFVLFFLILFCLLEILH